MTSQNIQIAIKSVLLYIFSCGFFLKTAIEEMFNISFGFLKIVSGNGVNFRKTRNLKNRINRENRISHVTKICKNVINDN